MLKNYVLVALRSLRKQKLYGFINVFGLAVGIAGCLLVGLYVRHELSFDRFHANADRIYRAWVEEDYGPDERFTNTVTPYVLAPTLQAAIPEVEAVVRVRPFGGVAKRGEEALNEAFAFVDPAFFEVFSFEVVRGDPATALTRPDGVVLTETAAERHFGTADPLGQPLTAVLDDQERPLVVTGVVADPPAHSSVRFGALLPFAQIEGLVPERMLQSWMIVTPETYVLLREGAALADAEAKLPAMMETALGPDFEGTYTVGLQPLLDVHFDTTLPAGNAPVSDPRYPLVLGAIALLVLLIACTNFTTLAVGRSVERTREVGVRKAIGARRWQLMGQFWGEAALLTVLAFVVGLAMAAAALPLFNALSGRELALRLDAGTGLLALGLVGLVALVAGGYPAAVLSRSRPADVLRGRLRLGTGTGVQRALVTLQLACSIALLAGTLVMAQQLRYLQATNLGFEADRVVVVPDVSPFRAGPEPLAPVRAALGGESAVAAVTASAFSFGDGAWGRVGYTDDAGRYRTFRMNAVLPDYLGALQIPLAAGDGFAAEPAVAARQAVVNAAFAEAYGVAGPGQPLPEPFDAYTVAGVTEDFHYASLHTAVEPLVLVVDPGPLFEALENVDFGANPALDVAVRLGPGPLPAALAAVEQAWTRAAPDRPFAFTFLDDALDQQYRAERRLGRIVGIASGLAVLIACLGLFGLAALTAAQRTKEIGIRKTLGASVAGIVALLSKDLARLLLVGFAVAAPVAYVLMGQWLDGFAYRVDLGPGAFVLAGGLALVVALLAVSVHTVRAATADPVHALRSE